MTKKLNDIKYWSSASLFGHTHGDYTTATIFSRVNVPPYYAKEKITWLKNLSALSTDLVLHFFAILMVIIQRQQYFRG
jgi:hypothetical protein